MIGSPYNDGMMSYGSTTPLYNDTRRKIGEDFREDGRFVFDEKSVREQDYQLIDSSASTLDIKIETPYPLHLENTDFVSKEVRIRGIRYSVLKVDKDRNKPALFWYLQKEGLVNE
ncbi:hypothetical protein CF394_11270 [Tetzosporium hominis]|uniref:Phage head-tail adapter protein n=1 Tax=Tetzosporium hominis TaxID=2020506 RepID=A0A264W1M1_9BACL|nr:phage head closure protein [Tetzosporium hominis]OZS77454.1 hypothetical protein CF394_11270 [Tetzosporium hominis]